MKKEYQATNYESDLTDKQWEAIKEFFPSGNKSKYHKRSLVEAVLYIVKTGCQWRMKCSPFVRQCGIIEIYQ